MTKKFPIRNYSNSFSFGGSSGINYDTKFTSSFLFQSETFSGFKKKRFLELHNVPFVFRQSPLILGGGATLEQPAPTSGG